VQVRVIQTASTVKIPTVRTMLKSDDRRAIEGFHDTTSESMTRNKSVHGPVTHAAYAISPAKRTPAVFGHNQQIRHTYRPKGWSDKTIIGLIQHLPFVKFRPQLTAMRHEEDNIRPP